MFIKNLRLIYYENETAKEAQSFRTKICTIWKQVLSGNITATRERGRINKHTKTTYNYLGVIHV